MEKRYTEFAEELLGVAEMTATELKHSYVGTGHLLYAMTTCPGGSSWQILLENGVNAKEIRHYLTTSKEYSGKRDPEAFARGHALTTYLLKYILRSPYTCRKNGSFRSLMK